jgi:hypothetical protein
MKISLFNLWIDKYITMFEILNYRIETQYIDRSLLAVTYDSDDNHIWVSVLFFEFNFYIPKP